MPVSVPSATPSGYDARGMSSTEITPQPDAAMAWSASALQGLLDALLTQARATRQRRTMVLAGDAPWCREVAEHWLALDSLSRITWIATAAPQGCEVLAAGQARQLLGQERDVLVFDAHAGFDADAFGAVSGSVCAGGLMILLCPALDAWESLADPAAERIAVWPYQVAQLSGRFLRRLSRVLRQAASPHEGGVQGLVLVEQGAPLPDVPAASIPSASAEMADEVFRTTDQREAVAAIEHVVHGHRRRPVVLVADRGRGKTAALGIAAARLLQAVHADPAKQTQAFRIVVTAPRLSAVQPLFQQASALLPDALVSDGHVQWGNASIQFVAPDVLCLTPLAAELVLVDEAAAIPAVLLQQLLQRYSRIAFSTTTHGYEGTGRGFAVRFVQTLNAQTPAWRELTLQTPVRWADGDPLEKLTFDALLLAAAAADDEMVAAATVNTVTIECIRREALVEDESLLSQVFGLLVDAHYRTSPNDLRNLLDGPDLSVYVARFQGQVVATALVANEGGFDAAITEAMFAGERRPRGHLIPQSLVVHAGIKAAASLRCARVMRIAVHPAVQRRGIGRHLLQQMKTAAAQQGADMFGASFGATAALLSFWSSEAVLPVRVGFRRGHDSGEYSVMVLLALSAAGASVYAAARRRFRNDLPQWLAEPLSEMDALEAASLLRGDDDATLSLPAAEDLAMLRSFSQGGRSYEDALAPIWRLLIAMAQRPAGLADAVDRSLLVAKVLQRQSWSAVAARGDLAGKAEVVAQLRHAVGVLLSMLENATSREESEVRTDDDI